MVGGEECRTSGTFVPLLCAYTLVAYLSKYALEILEILEILQVYFLLGIEDSVGT